MIPPMPQNITSKRKLAVSVLIMTQNEEANIAQALDSVTGAFDEIIVVDSFSSDRTMDILQNHPEIRVFQNKFQNWAAQRMWMIENCTIRNEVVFFLDADEYVTAAFVGELRRTMEGGALFNSIEVQPRYVFLNHELRFAYGHPRVRRIFRKQCVHFRSEGAREYSDQTERQLVMHEPLMHWDRKPIKDWLLKHLQNAEREAELFLARKSGATPSHRADKKLTWKIRAKLFVRERIWGRLPLFVRPILYFFYRYVFQLGFLDGRAGLAYCVLHALWYPMVIDAKILEKMSRRTAGSETDK
jgi:glycosyltransferase involved in cell wall biosynthesis